MSLSITRAQKVLHPGGYPCTAIGYLNPVWYKFLQYTAQWSGISDIGSGQVRLQLSSSTGVADLIVGGTIRFASANDGIYSGVNTGIILAINFVGTNTVDLSGVTYRGTSSGGYWTNLTKYKNLRIETRVTDSAGNVLSKALSSWYAQPNHIGLIDLQTELRSLFYQREKYPYIEDLYKYVSAKEYILEYRERYLDDFILDTSMGWIQVNEVILACPTRKQIREQYGNNLMDYVLKPPGVASAGGVGNNFSNWNFDVGGSLSPWLKTTEVATDLFNDWFWSSGNGGQADGSISNAIYQSVNVTAGSRRLVFRVVTGAFFTANYEIWAFDNPATYLSSGDLITSGTIPISSDISFDSNFTFPTNRQYVGFRFSNGAAFQGFFLGHLSFHNAVSSIINAPPGKWLERQERPVMWCLGATGIKKPISFILDEKAVELTGGGFIIKTSWYDVNETLISTVSQTPNGLIVGVYAFELPDAPANAKYAVVFARNLADTEAIVNAKGFELRELCDPYILLEYQNSLGGLSHHAFMTKHNVNIQPSQDKPITSIYEYDIENSEGNLFKDGTDWKAEITMYDDYIPTKDLIWVAELKTSKQVRILFPNGAKIFCVVQSTDTAWITGTKFSKISVVVRIPNNFNPLILNPNLTL